MKRILLASAVITFSTGINMSAAISQSIATFNSVAPAAQTQNLVIPGTHTFQRIIRSGTSLTAGGNFGDNPDFTGYVPISGSSTTGYLSVSHETLPAAISVLSMTFNANKLWSITSSGKVSLPAADIGITAAFCSGTVTPRNTIMVCEEINPSGDSNGDGYDDLGWIIEIDPATKTVINQDGTGGVDKLWAMGRQTHENVTIKSDQSVAYWGADNIDNGFLYKFVPAVPGNFSSGSLYVLETTIGLATGTWKQIANNTKPERNSIVAASVAAGAYNFQRIEDVEIGPDNKVYFASTATGRVYRLNDAGATVVNLGVFVESTTYDVDGAGPFAPAKFEWPDNLAFDGEGNLWVLQDGGDNHIWVVAPTHTTANPAIKIFANTPAGSEPTGITFSPDYKYMFLSFQHPGGNTAGQTDAAGDNVIFDAATTVVIARKENLGAFVLADRFIKMNAEEKNNGIDLSWSTLGMSDRTSYEIERSADGVTFNRIASIPSSFNNNAFYSYFDNNLPLSNNLYYRIKQCKVGDQCVYSETKLIKISSQKFLKVYALPGGNLIRVMYTANDAADILLQLYTNTGRELYREKRKTTQGLNEFNIAIENLSAGFYVLKVIEGDKMQSRSFVK
jgi:secreted PhoX family phosphatase